MQYHTATNTKTQNKLEADSKPVGNSSAQAHR